MPEAAEATTKAEASGAGPWSSATLPGNEDPSGAVATESEGTGQGAEKTPEEVSAEAAAKEDDPTRTKTPEEIAAEKVAADAAAAKATPPKKWAEQFETPEELEIAYGHSSREGKRLATELKAARQDHARELSALKDKIQELEITAQAGPEIKEPTEEELEAMGPVKAMRLMQKISERKNLLAQLKTKAEQRKKDEEADEAALTAHIRDVTRKMEADPENFPDFKALVPAMDKMLDLEPGLAGLPYSAQIVYLATYGQRALRQLGEVRAKEKAAAKTAAAKAGAASAATGAAGAAGTGGKAPDPKKNADPDSDEAHNERLLAAGARRSSGW